MQHIVADFHCHTSLTDGSDTPEQVFGLAKEKGLTHLAITDHDTLVGRKMHERLGRQYGITYIPGVEVSAYDYEHDKTCHIVGLMVSEDHTGLNAVIEATTKARHACSKWQVETLMALGYHLQWSDFEACRGYHGIYKQHIMDVLMKKGYTNSIYGPLYKSLFKCNGVLGRSITYPNHLEVIRLIIEAGGLPILAHPTLYSNLEDLEPMCQAGLKGVEAYYPSVSKAGIDQIKHFAKAYGLFISGGSDYHGDYADHSIGTVGDYGLSKDAKLMEVLEGYKAFQ